MVFKGMENMMAFHTQLTTAKADWRSKTRRLGRPGANPSPEAPTMGEHGPPKSTNPDLQLELRIS